MIRILSILIFISLSRLAWSQEKIIPDSIASRSFDMKIPEISIGKPLISESQLLLSGEVFGNPLNLNSPLLPDYNKLLDFRKALVFRTVSTNQPMRIGYGFLPFTTAGTVFNQAAYKISDRVIFGGASFGAQSVFDRPNLNSAIQNMSSKGASMFMQYKVSKNFKIETRVTISDHRSPWEP